MPWYAVFMKLLILLSYLSLTVTQNHRLLDYSEASLPFPLDAMHYWTNCDFDYQSLKVITKLFFIAKFFSQFTIVFLDDVSKRTAYKQQFSNCFITF